MSYKRLCLLTDSPSNRGETPSIITGPGSKLSILRTENQATSDVRLPATSSDSQQPPQTEESGFRKISGLLELGIICLPGNLH